MKDKIIKAMQKFSKAIVVPVLFLPAVGIMLVLCNLMVNPNITKYLTFLNNKVIFTVFTVFRDALMSIFTNLGPIFAIGIAFGLAKRKKEQAALVSFMSLFIYLAGQNSYLNLTGKLVKPDALYGSGQATMLGFQIIDMGVFLGIIIGLIVGFIHNKYCEKDLGEIFSVYGGSRFGFLILIPIMIALAIINTYIWPPVQYLIGSMSKMMLHSGPFGYFAFGFLERFLVPTGLHHLIGSPIWYTELGGAAEVGGKLYTGAWNIALAQLADPTVVKLSRTTIFNNTTFVKIFGLAGASLAMIKTAKLENKQKAKAVILPAMLTSVFAAITEPIEFTFLFLSPLLWLIHSLLTGAFLAILYILNITCVSSGGILETLLYNIPAGIQKTGWPGFIAVGLVQAVVYFYVFKWFIQKFDLKTPGREDGEVKLITKQEFEKKKNVAGNELGMAILKAIGGKDNLILVDSCFTRLRLELKDMSVIDEELLKEYNSKGVVKNGDEVQIIYGVNVGKYRKALEDALETL